MKILLAAPQPFYEERGTPIAVRWVVETLCRAGHEVDLVCYHRGEDISEERLNIVRAWGPSFIKQIPIGFSWQKMVCDIFLSWRMLSMAMKSHYDVVHAVEEAVFPAMLVRRIAKARLVFDMDSSMPDQLMEKWPKLGGIGQLMNWFERRAIRSADVVLPVCESLRDKVMEALPKGRVCILHDRALEGDVEGCAVEELRKDLSIRGRLLMYNGNLEHYQGIDLMLEALAKVETEVPWHMVVIGGKEVDIQQCRKLSTDLGLDNDVTFVGPRPVSSLQYYLSQADILLSPRAKGVNTPLKIYSYMLAGKGILATDIQSHTQVLDENCAVLVDPDAEAMADGIVRLLTDDDLLARLSQSARERALVRHTVKAYENALLSAYTFDMFVEVEKRGSQDSEFRSQ